MNTIEVIPVEVSPIIPLGLTELAAAINREHQECRESYIRSLIKARNCGELLILAKEQCRKTYGHGHWGKWHRENCAVPERTIQEYMQIARDWGALEESATIADLSFSDALRLLASPRNEDEDNGTPLELPELRPRKREVSFEVGSRLLVNNPSNPFNGQEIEVIDQKGKFLIAKGSGYPFLPEELESAAPPQEPKPQPQSEPRKFTAPQLRDLLKRVYMEAGGLLSPELLAELEAAIAAS